MPEGRAKVRGGERLTREGSMGMKRETPGDGRGKSRGGPLKPLLACESQGAIVPGMCNTDCPEPGKQNLKKIKMGDRVCTDANAEAGPRDEANRPTWGAERADGSSRGM
jgi:hypothetical protein